jgi:hypothetical protein
MHRTDASIAAMTADGETLEDSSRRLLQHVRGAFAGLLAAVPESTSRPHELEKALGLHKTLAWKVAKVVECREPADVYQYIPGPGAVNKILDAARKRGVADELLGDVRRSLAELDEHITEHAGDRDTFEMMVAGFVGPRRKETDLQYRRSAFRSPSYIWGVQARTMTRTVIVQPSRDDPATLDAAVITGCVDLRRLRAERSWVIYRGRPTDDEGEIIAAPREPIDLPPPDQAPFLSEFCRPSPPDVRRVILEDGTVEDELPGGVVGNSGAITCFTAEVLRGVVPRYRDERNATMAQNLELRTPCQTVIFDHLVSPDLFGAVRPTLRVFGELAGRPLYASLRSNRDRLDVFESVVHLGTGTRVVPTPDVPRYEEMIRYVCSQLGWDAEQFDVYRLRMEFPYVPSTITYDYPLPDAPE